MPGTISGVDPVSGLSFSDQIGTDPAAPVNTAGQDFQAIAAAAGVLAAGYGIATAPSPGTYAGGVAAASNLANNAGNITQGLADLTNSVGLGPAQGAAALDASAMEVGMMQGEIGNPPGTVSNTDFGDPNAPATDPSMASADPTSNGTDVASADTGAGSDAADDAGNAGGAEADAGGADADGGGGGAEAA